jgi:hypothetical protein
MKPTTDEPPRLDYSRARLEAMPITIAVYSEEATRLFAPSNEHEVFTPVPIPGHVDSLALLRRTFPESVYALEQLVGKMPTDAQYDDLGIEMAAPEELVEAQQLAHSAPFTRVRRTSASTRGLQQNPSIKRW